MIDGLISATSALASWSVVWALGVGIILGYFVGSLPGLTSSIGMALLIPFTFSMEPVPAIVMLVAIYMAADFAGSIPAVLVNAPGQPAAAVTAFDGYPMCQRGEAGKALALSVLSSGVGALSSVILLTFTAQLMAGFALAFGPAEYFALAVLGLSLVSALSSGSTLKAFLGLLFGLLLVTIGIDPFSGEPRFVIHYGLLEGIPFLPALIGLFALSEVFFMIEEAKDKPTPIRSAPPMSGALGVLGGYWRTLARSSIIGYLVGVIPGAGSSVASLVSYGTAKRYAKDSNSFGKGNPEGVVASEAANNASVSGALAPLLALGIPGSASAAVLIGGLTIQGLEPGPLLFANNPEVPYSVFLSLLLGIPIMLAVGLMGTRVWIRVTLIPKGIVATSVAGICLLGAYASSNDIFTVGVTVFFGIAGYLLRKIGVHPAPIVLALVLGNMMESNFRRAMVMSGDDWTFLVSKPISIVLLGCAFFILLQPLVEYLWRRKSTAGTDQSA